jgi:hypothetical protein
VLALRIYRRSSRATTYQYVNLHLSKILGKREVGVLVLATQLNPRWQGAGVEANAPYSLTSSRVASPSGCSCS